MSGWDGHLAAAIQASPIARFAVIFGPDGAPWGKYQQSNVCQAELAKVKSDKACSLCFEGDKYFYLRDIDGVGAYKKSDKSAAAFFGTQYGAVVLGAEGQKAEPCVDVIEKIKTYMSGIGYN